MARFLFTILSFALALLMINVEAAPLQARQIGGIACNVARLQIVTDLAQTKNLLSKVDTTDPAAADAVSTAQSGLDSASDGIKTIAGALITGQTAPAAARDQVATGLDSALTSLTGLNSTDTAVSDTVSKLNKAIAAGNQVVATCK